MRRLTLILELSLLSIILLFTLVWPRILSAQPAATGKLEVQVTDAATNQLTPVRVRLSRNGWAVKELPKAAVGVMYGVWDHADGYGFQPDSSFYIAGKFSLDLPPGTYHLSLAKGPEFVEQQHHLQINAQVHQINYSLTRWINMPEKGWYSADDHIHIRRSPREDSLLLTWTQAEDVHVGVMLRMGDFWETYYPQYAWGEKGVYQKKDYLLTSGQEDPRTPELGHALGIGASDKVRFAKEYYYYDKVFDKVRELGGLGGYAHQAKTFHGYRGLILDGLRGKVDVLELLQFCASDKPLLTEHYYHLLDLGIPVTAVAGSDFPWCGNDHQNGPPERSARLGNVRFYTYVDGSLTYNNWKAGLAAGHTFVSSGPMLDFKVNNKLPGDKLSVKKGAPLQITAHAYGHATQVPLQALEIVGHGQVLGRVTATDSGQSAEHLSLTIEIPAEQGIWLAARSYGNSKQAAHTTPVYVQVDGKNFYNPSTAPKYLKLSEQYLKELKKELKIKKTDPQYRVWQYRAGLERRIAETRLLIKSMKEKLK